MNLRDAKKPIPKNFRKQMYENYKANMRFYGKPIRPYKEWLKDVLNTKLPGHETLDRHLNATYKWRTDNDCIEPF